MDSDKLKLIVGVATSHIPVCKHAAEIGPSLGRQKKAEPRPVEPLPFLRVKVMPLVLLKVWGDFGGGILGLGCLRDWKD